MMRGRCDVIGRRRDQLSPTQVGERDLDRALGKAGCVRNGAKTRGDRFPFLPRGLAVEMQIDQISGWLLIVADQIAHQDVENVLVDGNGFAESGHGASRSEAAYSTCYTDKRTALCHETRRSCLDATMPVTLGSPHHDQTNQIR